MIQKIILAIGLCLCYASTAQHTIDWQGHRGCRGLMPENTLEAFKKALDLGVTTLEMDVCISQDKQVVVSHEPYMSALYMSKPDGTPVLAAEEKQFNLYQMPYKRIKQFDSGSRGNERFPTQQKLHTYKPLLREVIKACEKYRKKKGLPLVQYNIEIKSEASEYGISQPTVAEFSALVYAEIIALLPPQRVILQSFDLAVLQYWHQQIEQKHYQNIALSALTSDTLPQVLFEQLGFIPAYYSPYFKVLTPETINFCHEKGVKVVPWTVNEPTDLQHIQALGVDGIITDYPDRKP